MSTPAAVASTTTNTPPAPKFRHTIKGTLAIWSTGLPHPAEIHAFDLDDTIVSTKSGKVTPTSAADWYYRDQVIPTLQELGRIVIISNQKGAINHPHRLDRITAIYHDLTAQGIIVDIYVSLADDRYRKPMPGIFEDCIFFRGLTKFTFVGDAAGRPNDFSDSDRAFAYNVNFISHIHTLFYLPEYYFNRVDTPGKSWRHPDPNTFIDPASNEPSRKRLSAADIIIMVGAPGSGKSTLANELGGKVFSRDTMGAKFERAAKEYVLEQIINDSPKQIIIDNTNPKAATRQVWLDFAAEHQLRVEILWLAYPEELSMYLNTIRMLHGGAKVPQVAYAVYYKALESPTNAIIWHFQPRPDKYFGIRG